MSAQLPGSLTKHSFSHRRLLEAAASSIVDAERARLPDLSGVVVLVPGPHAVADAARALRAASGRSALLLPRITTLAQWAADVPLERPVLPNAAREALLYRALAQRDWLGGADRWAVAGELAALFDQLTRNAVALPESLADFSRQLERAYRAKKSRSLHFEARLVHELWHAVVQDAESLDAEAARQLRLARLAQEIDRPVYAIGLGRLARAEERFLERCAARVPVRRFEADGDAAGDAASLAIALAWPRATGEAHLIERAHRLKSAHPASPLAGRVRIFGAAHAEEEAQAVDLTVREWLLAGRQRIAVVVNDRVVARRARALLERAQVLVKDEAGWAFSTTSAATAIGRLLDVAGNDCYHRDLLDLMKSPFAFHDWGHEARRAVVWRLEGYVREAGIVAGLDNFIRLAEEKNDHEVRQMLARVQRGLNALGQGRRSIARWLESLHAALTEIGVAEGLAADSAGAQLLELLDGLRRELAEDRLAVSAAEWRRWLARALEGATFRERSIESPVVFTHLAATTLRAFDGVIVLGCDAAHLPGPDPVALFFNQGVRAELGLPLRADELRELEGQLAALIASSAEVLLTWQRMTGGEPNLLSPQLERLVALHRLAYDDGLEDGTLAARLAHAQVRAPDSTLPAPVEAPKPRIPGALVPSQISASGYNALVACPYQYYARHLLQLAELDEVQEEIDKSDYGQLVHAVLTKFHAAHPRVLDLDPAAAQQRLAALSAEAFAHMVARNYLAQAWLARWMRLIPDYLAWQREREAEGWRWKAGEAKGELEIATPRGRSIVLHGRIDRVDIDPDGRAAVIDYKTRSQKKLKDALEVPGEDVQLPVYALLWGGPVAAALFLSIEREGVKPVEVQSDIGELAAATRERLADLVDALHEGAPLPAQGADQVCDYCEMRGLCRRNYWP
jgi:ATP-dependent helicase/nuclease subunit B